MPKLEDSAKGEKSFGVMIYEPPYMYPRVKCPDGHLFRRVEICLPYVRWCERRSGDFKSSPVYSIVCSKYTHSFKLVCFVEWYTYVVVRIVNNKNTFDLYFVIIGYIVHVSIWSVIRK